MKDMLLIYIACSVTIMTLRFPAGNTTVSELDENAIRKAVKEEVDSAFRAHVDGLLANVGETVCRKNANVRDRPFGKTNVGDDDSRPSGNGIEARIDASAEPATVQPDEKRDGNGQDSDKQVFHNR